MGLDRGDLSLDDAIDRGAQRSGLPSDDVARFFAAVPPSLIPVAETIDLIRAVRRAGNSTFVLSNMHQASIEYLEQRHAIWDLFDGTVISCRIRAVKPEPEIYEYLLEKFGLRASDTIFIDDLAENVAVATRMGIRSIQFTDTNQCRRELGELGCLQGPAIS